MTATLLLGYSSAKSEPGLLTPEAPTPGALDEMMAAIVKDLASPEKLLIEDEAWKLLGGSAPFKFKGTTYSKISWEMSRPKYLTAGGNDLGLVQMLTELSDSKPLEWLPGTEEKPILSVVLDQSESGVLVSIDAPYTCSQLTQIFEEQFPQLTFRVSLSP